MSDDLHQQRKTTTTGQRVLIASLVVGFMVLVVVLGQKGQPAVSTIEPAGDPADSVTTMVTAAGQGDVSGYLDCFAGRLRDQLSQRAQVDAAQFAAFLRADAKELLGLATLRVEQLGTDRAQLVLERVYQEFRTRQEIGLCREPGGWKIDRLGPLERFVPEIRYGAPATLLPEPPEASPPDQ